jgi:glutamate racemase
MDNRPVGVFDSGVGGLTVADEIQKILPKESIIYAGDTARVPYGGLPPETLLKYGREIINYLINKHDVKAVVVACGTIGSNVFEELQKDFPDIPLIDVIKPGVAACADADPETVGFIATEATVRSGLFSRLLYKKKPGVTVKARACPLFVPMVEEGWVDNAVTQLVAETYLDGWKSAGLDTLVLGCTHYPLLTAVLRDVLGKDIRFINMAEYTARELQAVLESQAMLSQNDPQHRFFVSGYSDKFNTLSRLILKKDYAAEKTEWV